MRTTLSSIFGGILMLLIMSISADLFGQTTDVMIRAKSKDAKFIGTSIGGAKVLVKDATTGEILAEGITKGSTGDTGKIVKSPITRGKLLTDEDTAGFLAQLNIDEPTFVTVEIIAPVNQRQARVTSSTQLWVIPEKNITGDGVVLEVPGFVVDILSPQTHERIPSDKVVDITTNVVLMCGCPITSGGIWNADDYEVKAIVSREGKKVQTVDLEIQEKPSTFSGNISLPPGNYEVAVYAFDPKTGNSGLDRTNIIIQ